MQKALEVLDASIRSVVQLRAGLARRRVQRLVRAKDEQSLIKATCLAWFNAARPVILADAPSCQTDEVDETVRGLLARAERDSTRSAYLATLAELKASLINVRTDLLATPVSAPSASSSQSPPDFSPLVGDPRMQAILVRRWRETGLCIDAGADLAATVMIGGLLEGLLLARLNLMPDKAPAFRAAAAPKDRNGSTLPLRDWGLKNYIEVGHELTWISVSAKDVSVVVRDYRNYIHPAKELSHNLVLSTRDTAMLWSVFVTIASQIVDSARAP